MAKVAKLHSKGPPARSRVARPSVDAAESIKLLLSPLTQEEREHVLAEIEQYIRPVPVAKAGDVLGAIVKFLPRKGTLTVDDFKAAVKKTGLEAKPKEIYNAIGYLNRKGHIRRIGYGRYIVDGVEVITADDLGGETARHEDDYRTDVGNRLAPKERK
ncbi:hypothetical protein [Bosea sp. CS1GBMeth4]|uniref:hypothetical protein n=1 Tax=Bosea sp. CS1GBMeth4 TaxID=1892849 RepID=UPI001647970D|nr:hypothetical protein [Bosea sp. CS1GBMeth4]